MFASHFNRILSQCDPERALAIDVFRGIAITAMILVNNPGSWRYVYAPLQHAEWHGWTPTDLIFPFFIFIVGLSISLSLHAVRSEHSATLRTHSNLRLIKKASIRALKLFLLGLFLAAFYYNFRVESYDWWQQRILDIRIPGVLQRLAIVYWLCVLLALFCHRWALIIVGSLGLMIYTLALVFVPYSDGQQTFTGLLLHGNSFAAYIDNALFASQHLYYSDAKPFAFDPEGVLSTLPAVVSGISGVIVGRWWLSNTNQYHLIKKLLLSGVILTCLGLWLDFYHPINKALWTAPFVLLTTGFACLLLATLTYCLDLKGWRLWSAPFIVFGANSILFFMFAGVVARLTLMITVGEQSLKSWLYEQVYQPVFGNYFGSLVYAIVFLLCSYVVFYFLYKHRVFWKV